LVWRTHTVAGPEGGDSVHVRLLDHPTAGMPPRAKVIESIEAPLPSGGAGHKVRPIARNLDAERLEIDGGLMDHTAEGHEVATSHARKDSMPGHSNALTNARGIQALQERSTAAASGTMSS
jgi:hypothetical protein